MQFQFDNLAEFLSMNGHGPYVWAAYLVAGMVMGALAVAPVIRQRRLRREFARQLRLEEARRRAASSAPGANSRVAVAAG